MNQRIVFFLLFLLPFLSSAQDPDVDYSWWNELHQWPGHPGWRNWIIISPGYLGPNALPVPEIKRGFLNEKTELEVTASNHFNPNDPTQDIAGRFYIPFAKNKIAVEVYGVFLEHFAFSESIRNERFARIEDGKGFAFGDLYFSTLIQLSKNRKFPNTLLRMTGKTASGNKLEGARYTDSPGYFFDLSFSKNLKINENSLFRPFGLFGFYSWQTNDEENLQNDAYMYALGSDFVKDKWMFSTSWSGYSGYKNQRDRPMQLNFEIRHDWEGSAFRIQFIYGLRDYDYETLRISYIWKLNGIK
jgi:hypothetical protein